MVIMVLLSMASFLKYKQKLYFILKFPFANGRLILSKSQEHLSNKTFNSARKTQIILGDCLFHKQAYVLACVIQLCIEMKV